LFWDRVLLILLGWPQTRDLSASACWVAEITSVYHHVWLPQFDTHLDYFQFLAILNTAALNIFNICPLMDICTYFFWI
jgi:hypothetical protein